MILYYLRKYHTTKQLKARTSEIIVRMANLKKWDEAILVLIGKNEHDINFGAGIHSSPRSFSSMFIRMWDSFFRNEVTAAKRCSVFICTYIVSSWWWKLVITFTTLICFICSALNFNGTRDHSIENIAFSNTLFIECPRNQCQTKIFLMAIKYSRCLSVAYFRWINVRILFLSIILQVKIKRMGISHNLRAQFLLHEGSLYRLFISL